jgi:hypothetical protein|tara:strand:- start:842 stop:1186 length:345 start_codon:yes stop_codon:yes gene_type:complete
METKEELRNGLELVLALQLTLELMDEYRLKGLPKKYGNMFKNSIEKSMSQTYDRLYKNDPEFMTNSMNIKNEMISSIASLNEVDAILFASFTQHYMDNIDVAREKGTVFFSKLL